MQCLWEVPGYLEGWLWGEEHHSCGAGCLWACPDLSAASFSGQSTEGWMPVLPDRFAMKPAWETWITISVTVAKTVCALEEKDRGDASCFVSPVSSLIFCFRPSCSYESGLDLTSVFINQPSLQMRPLLNYLKSYVISSTALTFWEEKVEGWCTDLLASTYSDSLYPLFQLPWSIFRHTIYPLNELFSSAYGSNFS